VNGFSGREGNEATSQEKFGMTPKEFRGQLGEDLWALVQGRRSPLATVTVLTSLPSASGQRASFRLQFADGLVLKGRRFERGGHAERVENLSQFLDQRHFPRLLGRCGSALLLEWIEGEPLSHAKWPLELLQACGALQGLVHSTPLPQEMGSQNQPAANNKKVRLERGIRALVEYGAFNRLEGERLIDLAAAHTPGNPAVGLIHGDFCAENMVLQAPGHVYVIDSEKLSIDAYDYDLGRTWYRWPMTTVQRDAYYGGYNQHRSSADFMAHFVYWAIVVLVDSAAFRLRAGAGDVSVAIRQLETLQGVEARSGIPSPPESFIKAT